MERDSTVGLEQDGGQNVHESIDVSQRYKQIPVSNCIHKCPDKSAMMEGQGCRQLGAKNDRMMGIGMGGPTHPKQRPAAAGLRSCAWQQPPRAGRVVD